MNSSSIAPPSDRPQRGLDESTEQPGSPTPRVSVVMPVYNGEKYLEDAIDSILAQTFGDFEFVIINDGSTDRTREILDRYAARDARIRVRHRENRGITPTLNELLEMARGELVARMDADDIALPERFAKQVRFLNENPDCAVVGSPGFMIDPEGRDLNIWSVPTTHEAIVERLLGSGGVYPMLHPSIIFRRKPVVEIGGYREAYPYAEALDLYLRIAESSRLANLSEPLLKYRNHGGNTCFLHSRVQRDSGLRIRDEARRRRGMPPLESAPDQEPKALNMADKHRIWAWWALGSGHVATARGHALAALRLRPFSGENWRLLACVIRGR